MRTADLTGALLDYWTARAEGVPADQLEIRHLPRPGDPRTPDTICVHTAPPIPGFMSKPSRGLPYSTSWTLTGPLLEKHMLDVLCQSGRCWSAAEPDSIDVDGETALIAICRAVVRAAFGDEVEDLPCA